MSRSIQTVGVFKMGITQAQDPGFVIHQLVKAFHRTAAVNGQGHRRIVPGRKHQPIEQFLQGQHFPFLQVHGRAFDAHSLFGDPHPVQHVALLTDDQRRHDLRGTGDQTLLVAVLLKQHPSADRIQHAGPLCGHCLDLQR